jgi:2-polyprenyl-3-methyl-5-hydroxy-6-metoxy-1,4-benzoquinol methylase
VQEQIYKIKLSDLNYTVRFFTQPKKSINFAKNLKMSEWFKDWFNTKYYHVLYKNRNDEEARAFINKLLSKLELSKGAKVMDLACGKGRHALTLHESGLKVLGLDLSEESIKSANKYRSENLRFEVHDMREPYHETGFDAVFNLFTSFGYFENFDDNRKVLNSITTYLNPKGYLLIDYLNPVKVIADLVPFEKKDIEGISFEIRKSFDGQFIFKKIKVKDKNRVMDFEERVQAISHNNMLGLIEESGFQVEKVYGSYNLDEFDEESSERQIIVARLI